VEHPTRGARTQNPDGWIGEDWGGYGYDVYSFFPEFPPDGDPTNDDIGDDGRGGLARLRPARRLSGHLGGLLADRRRGTSR
jgi:hypothetical protein